MPNYLQRPDYLIDIGCLDPIKAPKGAKMKYYPCGKCIACQLKKANNNAQQTWYEFNGKKTFPLFVLLTYNNDNIPLCYCKYRVIKVGDKLKYEVVVGDLLDGIALYTSTLSEFQLKTLYKHARRENIKQVLGPFNKESGYFLFSRVRQYDLQLFHKRLRRNIEKEGLHSYRFAACSEYGPTCNRPHYHIILFCRDECERYQISRLVSKSWQLGYTSTKLYSGRGCNYISSYVTSSLSISYLHRRVAELRPKFTHSLHFGFEGCSRYFGMVSKMLDDPKEFFKSVVTIDDGKSKELFPLVQYYRATLPKLPRHDAIYVGSRCKTSHGAYRNEIAELVSAYFFPIEYYAFAFEDFANTKFYELSNSGIADLIKQRVGEHLKLYFKGLKDKHYEFSIDSVNKVYLERFVQYVASDLLERGCDIEYIERRVKHAFRVCMVHVKNILSYNSDVFTDYQYLACYDYCNKLHNFYSALDAVLLKKQLDKIERGSIQYGWIKCGVHLYDNCPEYLETYPGEYKYEPETEKKSTLYYQLYDYLNKLGEERSKMKKVKEGYTTKVRPDGVTAIGTNRIIVEQHKQNYYGKKRNGSGRTKKSRKS